MFPKRYKQEMLCHEVMTPEEEQAIGPAILAGDIEARNELIMRNQRLILWVLKRHFYGARVDEEDMISYGNIGLAKAAKWFDYRHENPFAGYAIPCIKSMMSRAVLDLSMPVKLPYEAIRHFKAIGKAIAKLGSSENIEEIMDMSGATKSGVIGFIAMHKTIIDLDVTQGHSGPQSITQDSLPCPNANSADMASMSMDRGLIEKLSVVLSEKQKDRTYRHFGIGYKHPQTLKEIGTAHNRSTQGIHKSIQVSIDLMMEKHKRDNAIAKANNGRMET